MTFTLDDQGRSVVTTQMGMVSLDMATIHADLGTHSEPTQTPAPSDTTPSSAEVNPTTNAERIAQIRQDNNPVVAPARAKLEAALVKVKAEDGYEGLATTAALETYRTAALKLVTAAEKAAAATAAAAAKEQAEAVKAAAMAEAAEAQEAAAAKAAFDDMMAASKAALQLTELERDNLAFKVIENPLMSKPDTLLTSAFVGADVGLRIVEGTGKGGIPGFWVATNSGWWEPHANSHSFTVRQTVRKALLPTIETLDAELKALRAINKSESMDLTPQQENRLSELEYARGVLASMEARCTQGGSEAGTLYTLPCLQAPPFKAKGLRVGEMLLETDGELQAEPREITRSENLTGISVTELAPAATWDDCPSWRSHVEAQFGSAGEMDTPEVEAWMRLLAYITMYPDDEGVKCWVHLLGEPNTGKTHWTLNLMRLLVNVAMISPEDLTGATEGSAGRFQGLAINPTARMLVCSREINRAVEGDIIKGVTSGTGLEAKALGVGSTFIGFKGALVTDSNQAPKFVSDAGLSDRLITVPFNTRIIEKPPMSDFVAEAPYFLRLVLEAGRRHRQDMSYHVNPVNALRLPAAWLAEKAEMQLAGMPISTVTDCFMKLGAGVETVRVPSGTFLDMLIQIDQTYRGLAKPETRNALADSFKHTKRGERLGKQRFRGKIKPAWAVAPAFGTDVVTQPYMWRDAAEALLNAKDCTDTRRQDIVDIIEILGVEKASKRLGETEAEWNAYNGTAAQWNNTIGQAAA